MLEAMGCSAALFTSGRVSKLELRTPDGYAQMASTRSSPGVTGSVHTVLYVLRGSRRRPTTGGKSNRIRSVQNDDCAVYGSLQFSTVLYSKRSPLNYISSCTYSCPSL